MPPKQIDPLTWRVVGKATDGMKVTLGKYDSQKKAEADCERFAREGYKSVRLVPIEQPVVDEAAEEAQRRGAGKVAKKVEAAPKAAPEAAPKAKAKAKAKRKAK